MERMNKVICTEFMTYNGKLYKIYRKIPKGVIKEEHILDVRDAWFCDKVLKTKNHDRSKEIYLFLVECPDAVIIENREESQ